MSSIFLIFPHQLFENIELLKSFDEVYLIEEQLFFRQYKFHKQKLVLHRASMKYYESFLKRNKIPVQYIESTQEQQDIRILISEFKVQKPIRIEYYDVCDDWLHSRIQEVCLQNNIACKTHPSELFLTSSQNLESYFGSKKKYFQTDFYIQQRKRLKLLIDEKQQPSGGKWSFDADNRLKYPKEKKAPTIEFPKINSYYQEAINYVEKNFSDHYGTISESFVYPSTHEESRIWLSQFLKDRFLEFGEYEDAIVETESVLHHSVLTPMLNIGLLTPGQIIDTTIHFANENHIPINSLEGFIRQIIGWREFIRGVYLYKGRKERSRNFWQFKRKIPASFYNGTTGIEPIDATIKKVLKTGYCHHIERLMLLGNFMLLCEFDPDEVYQWFMELFVDSYDWVMVPNVYGMSQFADGGIMATKPYISGSSYVLKMSNYRKGNWCEVWDALFWSFMNKQRHFFSSNPRLGMLLKTYDKMSEEKKTNLETVTQKFLLKLE